jgi:asparagine synthase (glutamine-hydrolysing)
MCGISGIYKLSERASLEDIDYGSLNAKLHHRGPDSQGILLHDHIILGHSRLAITDLGALGHQPMISSCGQYRIVFNGEIYNYAELKKEIQKIKPSLNFKSHSDTEIILESFAIWGAKAVYKWNGMFSMAIWDDADESLWLFRDRMGEKPLYYYHDHKYFCFASELKFIEALPFFTPETDQRSVVDFLHLGLIPDPFTIYSNVHKLRAGFYMHISNAQIVEQPYWQTTDSILPECFSNEEEAAARLEELLQQSVASRLSPNLTNGIFLSGGIDSSALAAMAAKSGNGKLLSFSLGFDNLKHNENRHAEKVARHLGIEHHSVNVSSREAADELEKLPYVFDEPFGDSSAIAVLLLSKYASKKVKVVLTGEGSDELFFGYGRYGWSKYLSNPLVWGSRHLLSKILRSGNARQRRAGGLLDTDRNGLHSHTLSHDHNLFTLKELSMNLKGFSRPKYTNSFADLRRDLSMPEQQALFDLDFYLKDDLLVKLDRAAMYYSLESRCPFLDPELVAFALNLSPSLKVRNGSRKYLLKKVLYKYVPQNYFHRPKQGFAIPLQEWLKNDFKHLVNEYLDPALIKKAGWFEPSYVHGLKTAFFNGKENLSNRLWNLMLLHKWYGQKMAGSNSKILSLTSAGE